MRLADFEAAFERLLAAHDGKARDNERSIECVDCERCVECTFCRGSKALVRCHYCVDSERCFGCTHCRSSSELLGCNHCTACTRCTQSAYLAQCVDCSDCSYCFGCVGLTKSDFCILNEQYDRREYFEITAKLSPALRPGRR